jgi:hypothetical protein
MNDEEYYEAARNPIVAYEPTIRPNQIRGFKNIKPGLKIVICDIHKTRVLATVQGTPRLDNIGWWLSVKIGNDISDISLADRGVVPYKKGGWNRINWIESVPQ